MIKRVVLHAGPTSGTPGLWFEPGNITVFVGPNNSGKSLLLREIEEATTSNKKLTRRVLKSLFFRIPPAIESRRFIDERKLPRTQKLGQGLVQIFTAPSIGGPIREPLLTVNESSLVQSFERLESVPDGFIEDDQVPSDVLNVFYHPQVLALEGPTRFLLTSSRESGDLLGPPRNHLSALFINDQNRQKVRGYVHDAFNLHFVIDPTFSGHLRIRLATRAPVDNEEEQSLSERSRKFHSNAARIEDYSDGVKAFVGIISVLMSSEFKTVLIDEPEAFLFPPLARKLGRTMANVSSERSANLLVATHSADFLMGCVESGAKLNIVRLTYDGSAASARLLENDRIEVLMRDPLLRSTGLLNGLFHSSVVVCEADSDRAFYQEVNRRMLDGSRDGIKDAAFINAQNKQTVRRMIEPLREMGVAAAAIVDLDILKGKDLRDLLDACKVPGPIITSLGQLRGELEAGFRQGGYEMNPEGLAALTPVMRTSLEQLLSQLKQFGIFVVPTGEVESWLRHLDVSERKPEWLPAMFTRMGADPTTPDYVKPSTGDIWSFIEDVAHWCHNPNRKGMPYYREA